jgi:hypothetical protein
VEAQRVLAVIDHLIRDLDLAFLVPPKVTASSSFDVATFSSSDSLKSLRKQHELETSLLSILSRTGGNIPDASQDSEDEPISQEWSLTAKALQKNVRDICREFRGDPDLMQRMRGMNLSGHATETFSQFRTLAMQLRTQVTKKNICTSFIFSRAWIHSISFHSIPFHFNPFWSGLNLAR